MLRTYLVFEPVSGGRTPETAQRVVFVREKFYWLALLFAPLWLLVNRLWLPLVLWCAAEALLAVALYALGWQHGAANAIYLLPSLIVALEGAAFKRFRLVQKGYREAAAVYAEGLEAAERRFFERWREPDARPLSPLPPAAPPAAAAPFASVPSAGGAVLGLFPEPWRGR